MTQRPHSGHIEVAVAQHLGYRQNIIVPNVSWGLGLRHECDMLALDDSDRFTEIEIKCTASDLKADFLKTHGHRSKIISRLVYAMPERLCMKYKHLIPDGVGIISVRNTAEPGDIPCYKASWLRMCRHKVVDRPDSDTIRNFMRLGCMRIWSLKAHNNRKTERKNQVLKEIKETK